MTKKMATLKPQIDALQKKYANNQEKLAQEQMKLYKTAGYNPLGCVGTMIPQLFILYALIGVIRVVSSNDLEGIYPFIQDWVFGGQDMVLNTQFFFWDLTRSFNDLSGEFGKFSLQALPYIVLAVFVGISQFFATKFTQKMQNPTESKKKKKKTAELSQEEMQKKMMGSMILLLPLMTAFISISSVSALGLYWLVQSIMLVFQYSVLDWDKAKKGVQNLFTMRKEGKAPKKKISK